MGVVIGHATDVDGGTGLTVVRGVDGPLRGAVAVSGRASGSRELAALDPSHLADRVDAVVLTGGSAYGLDAAAGAMRWLEERGRGFNVGAGVVPIVPAAVIFDLAPCGRFDARPTADMAYQACESATAMNVAQGSVGAGTGATVGKGAGIENAMKGGVGVAMTSSGNLFAGAVAVVNAFGDVRDSSGTIIAGARSDSGFADTAALVAAMQSSPRFDAPVLQNTTIACVFTNVALDRVDLQQVARSSGTAFARRISPSATSMDGDLIFALAPHAGASAPVLQVEQLAIGALEIAIESAVRSALGRDGIPGLADR